MSVFCYSLLFEESSFGSVSISMNYSFSGLGHDLHNPSLAIKLLGHRLQNLLFSIGTKPSGQLLHDPSKFTFSFGLHSEHEFLSPLGNEPSGHGSHIPSELTISSIFGHGSHSLRSGLNGNTVNLLKYSFLYVGNKKILC